MTTRKRRRPAPSRRPNVGGGALTARQQRFVAEYLLDLNAAAAYRRAGYAAKDAHKKASALMAIHGIRAAIAAAQAARLARYEVRADRVLAELAAVGFANGRDYWTPHGTVIHPTDLSVEAGAALAGFEVLIKNAEAGDGKTDTVHKFKLWDKVRALELLAKHLRLLDEHIEITDASARVARLEAGRARVAAAVAAKKAETKS